MVVFARFEFSVLFFRQPFRAKKDDRMSRLLGCAMWFAYLVIAFFILPQSNFYRNAPGDMTLSLNDFWWGSVIFACFVLSFLLLVPGSTFVLVTPRTQSNWERLRFLWKMKGWWAWVAGRLFKFRLFAYCLGLFYFFCFFSVCKCLSVFAFAWLQ